MGRRSHVLEEGKKGGLKTREGTGEKEERRDGEEGEPGREAPGVWVHTVAGW